MTTDNNPTDRMRIHHYVIGLGHIAVVYFLAISSFVWILTQYLVLENAHPSSRANHFVLMQNNHYESDRSANIQNDE
jgi:hypothetical protein